MVNKRVRLPEELIELLERIGYEESYMLLSQSLGHPVPQTGQPCPTPVPPVVPPLSQSVPSTRDLRNQIDLALDSSREEFALTTLALFQKYLKCCGFVSTKAGDRPINLEFGVRSEVAEALANKLGELEE